MADLLKILSDPRNYSNKSKSELVKEYYSAISSELEVVDKLLALSKELYDGGKQAEGTRLLQISNSHLENIRKIQEAVVAIIGMAG